MNGSDIETLGATAISLLLIAFVFAVAIMCSLLWVGWWYSRRRGALCPYTKSQLSLGMDTAALIAKIVEEFMLNFEQPDNEPFDMKYAAISTSTGRIFPDCVTRGEIISLDWTFLERRFPGKWVSWGSLGENERGEIKMCHESLAGYQTASSAVAARPQNIDPYDANLRPGPLYVDRETKMLLGWKEVPGTEYEVLIVQKPIYQSIDETL